MFADASEPLWMTMERRRWDLMNAIGGNRVAVLVEFGGTGGGGGGGGPRKTRRHPKNFDILLPTALVDITHHYHQYYHCPQQYQQFNCYHHPCFFVPLPRPVNLRNTSTTTSTLHRQDRGRRRRGHDDWTNGKS
jgi:hypothetical protein